MGIIKMPTDRDVDKIEVYDGVCFISAKNKAPHYTMGRGEIEIIARHMGLIPETVKDPAPPEITKEQHFAIWHSAFTRSFNPMNGISPAIDYADAAVAAFRGSLRKGGGE